jgi:ribonuclease HI
LVNVDAALFASSRQMSAGVVIRDHMGMCVAACSNTIEEITIPELAEAHAVRLALSFAKAEGLSNVQLATDCLSVVQRITSKEMDRSLCGVVIQDIQELIASFIVCNVFHVRREQNVAAHILARSCESSGCRVWHGVPPDCIRETICIDVMLVQQ